jgi:prepilin-type N-terminal cleavage/methylation domain-containing protein
MKEKGFTLIELLIVLALIAILAVILIVVIKPGQIFTRARDTQRSGDLRNLSQAVDAYLIELAANPDLGWPTNCATTVYFSVGSVPPTGWPTPTNSSGTTSQAVNGTGWVPLNFSQVSVLNLSKLPLDPRNGQTGSVNGTTTVFAYSFACDQANFNYEFAAKLESGISSMANDGGNRNCTGTDPRDCLYEVGPGKDLY